MKRDELEEKGRNPLWAAVFGAEVSRQFAKASEWSGYAVAIERMRDHIEEAEFLADLTIEAIEEM